MMIIPTSFPGFLIFSPSRSEKGEGLGEGGKLRRAGLLESIVGEKGVT